MKQLLKLLLIRKNTSNRSIIIDKEIIAQFMVLDADNICKCFVV
jgi:hypothetical protein